MLTNVLVFVHVLLAFSLIGLVLAHSGKDAGLSGAFGIGQSQFGATQVMERNLTRLTVVVATVFFLNTVLLYRLLA